MKSHIFSQPLEFAPGINVITVTAAGRACHLLMAEGSSLLVNCLPDLSPADITNEGYPMPSEIWHTQVDDALAAEGTDFAGTMIRIPENFAAVAAGSEAYWKAARGRWENPENWMEDLGHQPYGIAGSLILRPPAKPLGPFETFQPGGLLTWSGLEFEVWDFSVRNFYAVGFALRTQTRIVALFCGDLVHGDGNLPDAHGFEFNYSAPPWDRISAAIHRAAARKPQWLFPSAGQICPDATPVLDQLARRIDVYQNQLTAPESPHPTQPALFGRYYGHGDSVYQIVVNYGNVILLINSEGGGLLIDPGPCDFENPRRTEDFVADLEMFESRAGLKKIDLVMVTHFHGDHFDMWPTVKARYPGCKLATWRPVADVMRNPENYPYACLLSWYGLGWNQCPVDIETTRQAPIEWGGVPVHTVYLPGHCFAHAGYWLDWKGRRILFSGDSIQTRGVADDLQLLMSNHSVPGTQEGHSTAYRNVMPLGINLNLGGHGSHFENCATVYQSSCDRIEETTGHLLALFGNRRPEEIFVREALRPAAEKIRQLMAVS